MSVPPCERGAAVHVASSGERAVMSEEESGQLSVYQDGNCGNLVDAAFLYVTECRYPEGSNNSEKRAIRKKAAMFVVRHGVMFFKKKKKGKV